MQAFLGQWHGYESLPDSIPAHEFEALLQSLKEIDGNLDRVKAWYKKDINAVPPEYLLQPISSILGICKLVHLTGIEISQHSLLKAIQVVYLPFVFYF